MIYGTVHGRIIKDAENFIYGGDKVGLKFTVISNDRYSYTKEDPEPTFVNVTVFRGNTNFQNALSKGRLVSVTGEMQQLRDENGQNYNIQIVADDILLGQLPASHSEESSPQEQAGPTISMEAGYNDPF